MLTVTSVNSIDAAIDMLRFSPLALCASLAIFSSSKPSMTYVSDWTPSAVISYNCFTPLSYTTSDTQSLISSFGRPKCVISEIGKLGRADCHRIRALVKKSVRSLSPEGSGKRIDIFDQLKYLVKGIAAVAGVTAAVAAFYTGQAIYRMYVK